MWYAVSVNRESEQTMKAELIDGKALAAETRAKVKAGVAELKAKTGVTPGLGVVLVGDDPASRSYVTAKERALEEAGMRSVDVRLPAETTQEELLAVIARLNADPQVHGILVQLPLPRGLDADAVIEAIAPEKDVDGFTPINVGKLILGQDCFLPCTPHGVLRLLQRAGARTRGAHVVVVGRSAIVGRPLANLLSRKAPDGDATVTLCHSATPDLARFTRAADILIVAAGRPGTVTGDMVKPGAVVIDVGVNRVPDPTAQRGYRLRGDCDFEGVAEVASALTPVPGGVGPMTIAMLLENTLKAAQRAAGGAS